MIGAQLESFGYLPVFVVPHHLRDDDIGLGEVFTECTSDSHQLGFGSQARRHAGGNEESEGYGSEAVTPAGAGNGAGSLQNGRAALFRDVVARQQFYSAGVPVAFGCAGMAPSGDRIAGHRVDLGQSEMRFGEVTI